MWRSWQAWTVLKSLKITFRRPGSPKGAILRYSFSFGIPRFRFVHADLGVRFTSHGNEQFHLPGATTKMPFPFTGTKMWAFLALTATE